MTKKETKKRENEITKANDTDESEWRFYTLFKLYSEIVKWCFFKKNIFFFENDFFFDVQK